MNDFQYNATILLGGSVSVDGILDKPARDRFDKAA